MYYDFALFSWPLYKSLPDYVLQYYVLQSRITILHKMSFSLSIDLNYCNCRLSVSCWTLSRYTVSHDHWCEFLCGGCDSVKLVLSRFWYFIEWLRSRAHVICRKCIVKYVILNFMFLMQSIGFSKWSYLYGKSQVFWELVWLVFCL